MSASSRYTAIKGVQDIMPPDIFLWQNAENIAKEVFSFYGYQELRAPIIESTDIFVRSIGETSDIVEKEMYTFADKADRSITLRPEGTAPVVRCYIENHLYSLPSPQKFYYSGPMFRYERPQKGRFRQFYQIGAEAFGVAEPKIDAEILAMLREYLNAIGLNELTCEINSIGCEDCRPSFRTALRDFFHDRQGALCPDCQRRFTLNPLRILDCKIEACIGLRKGSPHVTDFLCGPCKEHFEMLLSLLKLLDLPYVINPELVRGLDYYTRTTFEITTEHLGAQKAVAAGGRYDRLVSEFGGPPTAAIGFAIGMERLAALMKTITVHDVPVPKVVIAALGAAAEREGLLIAQRLRKHGIWAELGYDNKSLKSQMRRADKLGADYVLIMGDDEINSGILKWKRLSDKTQGEIPVSEAHTMFIRQHQAFLP